MKVTESEKIHGIALFIDFKKALDSLDRNFLFKTLEVCTSLLPTLNVKITQ